MTYMQIIPVKTKKVTPPQDDIFSILDESLPTIKDGDVLVVTSIIASIHQGRCLKIEDVPDKEELIKSEADDVWQWPGMEDRIGMTRVSTTLMPFAGVDESNANGYYVLTPKDPSKLAKKITEYLKDKYKVKNLAVIIADSTFWPMRSGNVSLSLGFYGIEPVVDYKGDADVFGREIMLTRSNRVDPLAGIAGLYMGDGSEQTPLVILRAFDKVMFTNKETHKELEYPIGQDFYAPLLQK
jgi:F420-0:gamma-glutamyl ligase